MKFPQYFLKKCEFILNPVITSLFNKSLSSGIQIFINVYSINFDLKKKAVHV